MATVAATAATTDRKSLAYAWKTFVAGGVAGCAAKTLVAPLDRVKILFQTQAPEYRKHAGSLSGIYRAASDIYQHHGVRGLYQGHSATLLRIFPYAAIKFMAYEQYKTVLVPTREHATPLRLAVVGSMAGVTSVFCTYPLELVRVRLAFSSDPRGLLPLLRDIYNEEPAKRLGVPVLSRVSNFYRGFMPSVYGMVPYAGVSFMVYERLKRRIRKHEPTWSPSTVQLVAGGLAGATAQTVSYPFDIVRRRMQVSGARYKGQPLPASATSAQQVNPYRNSWTTAAQIWRQFGWRGFFVGLSIGYIKVTPMSMASFWTYEMCKRMLNVHDAE
ncbi:coenzyme A transporter [Sorochytrium milnesiophthora]